MRESIKKDAENCYCYLEKKYNVEIDKNSFKKIHKIAYTYLNLDLLIEDQECKVYFEEILSNIICILYSFNIQTDKIISMINRNTIDNLLRICKIKYNLGVEFSRLNIEKKFNTIKAYNSFDKLEAYSKCLDFLLNEYKIACGYIHSTNEEYLSTNNNLKEYNFDVLHVNVDKIVKFHEKILFILLVIFEKDLRNKNHDICCQVRSYLNKSYIKEYVKYFYNARF